MISQIVCASILASMAAASGRIRANRHKHGLRASATAVDIRATALVYCLDRKGKVVEDGFQANSEYDKICWRTNKDNAFMAFYLTEDALTENTPAVVLDFGPMGTLQEVGSIEGKILSGTDRARCGTAKIHKFCIEVQGTYINTDGTEGEQQAISLYLPMEKGG